MTEQTKLSDRMETMAVEHELSLSDRAEAWALDHDITFLDGASSDVTCKCFHPDDWAKLIEKVRQLEAVAISRSRKIRALQRKYDRGNELLYQLQVQLAGCLTAADGGTLDPAQQGDYGWSPAYQRVLDLRLKHDDLARRRDSIRLFLQVYEQGDEDDKTEFTVHWSDLQLWAGLRDNPTEPIKKAGES